MPYYNSYSTGIVTRIIYEHREQTPKMPRTRVFTIRTKRLVYKKFAATHYLIKRGGSDENKSRPKRGSASERGEDKVRVPSRAWLCIMYNGVQHKLVFI